MNGNMGVTITGSTQQHKGHIRLVIWSIANYLSDGGGNADHVWLFINDVTADEQRAPRSDSAKRCKMNWTAKKWDTPRQSPDFNPTTQSSSNYGRVW